MEREKMCTSLTNIIDLLMQCCDNCHLASLCSLCLYCLIFLLSVAWKMALCSLFSIKRVHYPIVCKYLLGGRYVLYRHMQQQKYLTPNITWFMKCDWNKRLLNKPLWKLIMKNLIFIVQINFISDKNRWNWWPAVRLYRSLHHSYSSSSQHTLVNSKFVS